MIPRPLTVHSRDPGQTPVRLPDLYTLTEAAQRLGLSREALRLRVRRGRLPAIKVDGQWCVRLDDAAQVTPVETPDRPRVRPAGHDPGLTPDTRSESRDELVTQLREQIEALTAETGRLWAELDHRTEEIRRRDHIIAALAQRPLELAAPAAAPPPGAPSASPSGRRPARRPPWWVRVWSALSS